MNIIKLDATNSTNDYLKQLIKDSNPVNYTTVVAKNQTNGKGQRGSVWETKLGKNLTMSILIEGVIVDSTHIFDLNRVVALAIISVLESYKIENLAIKWPNDIMADNYKIGGILIENSFKPDKKIVSIVGIGLNVNQTSFENLPQANSLINLVGCEFDLDGMLFKIIQSLQEKIKLIANEKFETIQNEYLSKLFKLNVKMNFKDKQQQLFEGKIIGVSKIGLLQVELENEGLKEFDLKEIQFLY